ncbi:MAG: hypothetical protein ABL949_02820 [Fimbriimonadaceae bacterium]
MKIAPQALDGQFIPVKIKEQSSSIFGDLYSNDSYQFASLGIRSDDQRIAQLFEMVSVSWTNSQLVELYGQKFLVTYVFQPTNEMIKWVVQGQPLPEAMLKLKLMKADQIGSIQPFPDLTKEKFVNTLNEFGQKGTPTFSSSTATQALSNAKQISTAMAIYLADSDDVLPWVQSSAGAHRVLEPYTKNKDLFKTLNPKGSGTFRFNMSLAGVASTAIEDPAATPLFYEPIPYPDGRYLVSFADTHAKFVSPEEWKSLQKLLKLKLPRQGKPIKGG